MRKNPTKPEDGAPDSEDRMRELVALTERVELRPSRTPETVVAGFRRDGRLSLYFGDDPYYQFDEAGRLRRAFVDGRLFRTQGASLAALTRERTAAETVLVRHDLVPAELEEFLAQMLNRIGLLRDALAKSEFEIVDQIPSATPIVERLLKVLDAVFDAAGELAPTMNRMR